MICIPYNAIGVFIRKNKCAFCGSSKAIFVHLRSAGIAVERFERGKSSYEMFVRRSLLDLVESHSIL